MEVARGASAGMTAMGRLSASGIVAFWCLALRLAAGRSPATAEADEIIRPEAKAQTAPVPHRGDAADDPAICDQLYLEGIQSSIIAFGVLVRSNSRMKSYSLP